MGFKRSRSARAERVIQDFNYSCSCSNYFLWVSSGRGARERSEWFRTSTIPVHVLIYFLWVSSGRGAHERREWFRTSIEFSLCKYTDKCSFANNSLLNYSLLLRSLPVIRIHTLYLTTKKNEKPKWLSWTFGHLI